MESLWNKSVHTLRFNFKLDILRLFFLEGKTWVARAEALRGLFFKECLQCFSILRAALMSSGQHAAYPDQFLY